jgi:NAD(P)-dependent dehydrogenase (short-subunit alcohol dehydrogenase family)
MRRVTAALMVPAAIAAAIYGLRPRTPYGWGGRVVVITGGSRGLGLVLARALSARNARVALLARDAAELARAKASFPATARVLAVPCDVRDAHQARAAIDEVVTTWGRLDVLVNNAGVIVSAPFVETNDDDFRALLDVHLWGTLHMTRAALPHLVGRRGARIVNVTSIGGKIPVPHLSAYCASKFAQAGLSAVMAEELRETGVRVVTVYPGLMRTGSHVNAQFKGDLAAEYAIFTSAGTLPGISMGAERAARAIIRATESGRSELVLPFLVRQVARAAALVPGAAQQVMAAVNRLLPDGDSHRVGLSRVRGLDIGLPAPVRAAAALGERAADRNNERLARRID